MASENNSRIEVDGIPIDLRNKALAALLAWLLPGLGHLYQRRYAKGVLYLVCILSIYLIGFAVGGASVVYASRIPGDFRWHYACQLGVGVPALPALVQSARINRATRLDPELETAGTQYPYRTEQGFEPWWGGLMSPPRRPVFDQKADEISAWYARAGAGYEMGTWYTVIAGLLNILVIYDAYSGPLAIPISGRKKKDGDSDDEEGTSSDASDGSPRKHQAKGDST